MGLLSEYVFNGIVAGCVYLLFTVGFTLIFGTFRIINMAQGAFLVVGGFVGIYIDNQLGWPLVASALGAVVAAGLVAVVMDVLVVRPSARAAEGAHVLGNDFAPFVTTLAAGTIIIGVLTNFVGHVPYTFTSVSWLLEPLVGFVSRMDVFLLLSAGILSGSLYYGITKTRAGSKIRAVAEDRAMASAVGIRPGSVSSLTFFVAGATAGLAGVLIGVAFSGINVSIGDNYLFFAFVIATVGGLGSMAGTAVASIAIGIFQQVGGAYLSQPVLNMMFFALLLVTLIVRPAGLFGSRVTTHGVSRT